MRRKISVVIICKNEEHIIGTTLKSVQGIADEIVVYDSGSTDNTVPVIRASGARLIEGPWEGYGKTKQLAIAAAANDWILNIDADEVLDEPLQKAIDALTLDDEKVVYAARFRNYLGPVCLKWGEFGFGQHIRLFNRRAVNMNDSRVHERLEMPAGTRRVLLPGHILHYTMKDTREFVNKSVQYALLNAEQYHSKGKKASWVKQYLAPPFTFIKYYFFRLGFLDGWGVLFSARMASLYTYVKYARLHELHITSGKKS